MNIYIRVAFYFGISFLILPDCRAQLLDPASQPHFINTLPIMPRVDVTSGGSSIEVSMKDTMQDLGIVINGNPVLTNVWGYDFGNGTTYPGNTIVAKQNVPVDIKWINNLRNGYLFPIDTSILWAFRNKPGIFDLATRTPVPAVTHLHGAHTESISDGLAEAWYTPDYTYRGDNFLKTDDGTNTGNPLPFHFDNDQRGTTLWYHDHVLGADRYSVYSGLAGTYILRDDAEEALIASDSLPSGPYEIELLLQDKMFTDNGQLYYAQDPDSSIEPAVSVHPEFFGDVNLVNGKAWPKLEVEPRPYRFRIVNASDSRFYNLYLDDDKKNFMQIGTDGGLLEMPEQIQELLIGSAIRADIVIDFSNYAGDTVVLRNDANAPYPDGDDGVFPSTNEVMAFIVNQPLNNAHPKAILPASFTAFTPQPSPTVTRQLVLFETTDKYGRILPSLGTVAGGILPMDAPVTEMPLLNSTEMWEIYNGTDDAHPIHLHLVQFHVINTQDFMADMNDSTGVFSNIMLMGSTHPPRTAQKGWKDTAPMFPGEVTRIVVTFDRAGMYMWHCHILSHEDHQMMRPFMVMDATAIQETSLASPNSMLLAQNFPNPFNNSSQINFTLQKDELVNLSIYTVEGEKVAELINQRLPKGTHSVSVDGDGLSAGLYYYSLQTTHGSLNRKMEVIK